MSFSFNGASNAHISRTTGNPASTNSFTQTVWIKRTVAFTGLKFLGSFAPDPELTAHDWVINDPNYDGGVAHYKSTLQANWATATAGPTPTFAVNVWTFAVVVGSGSNITLRVWDGSAWMVYTVGQSAFVPGAWRMGGSGFGSGFTGLMAHLRTWSVALTESELNAERTSATPVRTLNLLSAHSGAGGTIEAALTGQSGTAYTNGGGTTYDADQPVFAAASEVTVSGSATMPYLAVTGSNFIRFNRLLHSGNLANAVWAKQGNIVAAGAALAPVGFGTSQRILMQVNTGGVYQVMFNLPGGRSLAVMAARRVDTDYIVLKHQAENFASGVRGLFNLVTGVWTTSAGFGGVTPEGSFARSIGNGWHLFGLAATIAGNRSLEFFPTLDTTQVPAVNRSVDVCAFQYEDADATPKMTSHKPTTTSVVSRSFASITATLDNPTIGVGELAGVVAQLLDDTGAGWDQFGPVDFTSSDTTKVGILHAATVETDNSGRISRVLDGLAAGTSVITATGGGQSDSKTQTVGATSTARFVEIMVEGGWGGTSGWNVGVYAKHATERFPTTRLFIAYGQSFSQSGTKSRMVVPVPSAVAVTAGQVVEVVLENDNVNGRPVDGPGIFPAVVI